MTLRLYTRLWLVILIALGWEWYALNHNTFVSFFALLKENIPELSSLNLAPQPGKTISLLYGWTGLSLMLLTNLYVLRKRWAPLRNLGRPSGWLDFHIFCGLVGPTFILFHTNFKIGGLVALSFWAMVISFASGVIGRYFFTQIVSQVTTMEETLSRTEQELKRFEEQSRTGQQESKIEELKERTLLFAGGISSAPGEKTTLTVPAVLLKSMMGDVRLLFRMPKEVRSLPASVQENLRQYAVAKRRIAYLGQFQNVMGYWHSFHLPFAVFMYVVAAIHIVTALLFQVAD